MISRGAAGLRAIIRHTSRMALALMVALATLSPVDAQVATEDPTVEAPEQAVSVAPTAEDGAIGDRIEDILAATGWYREITVDVADGVVFLDGIAGTAEQRKWARDLAAKTEDVVAVVNRIEVDRQVSWSFGPALEEMRALAASFMTAFPYLVLAAIILPLAWIVSSLAARLARWAMSGRVQSPFLLGIIARAVSIPILLIGLYIVLQVAGLTQLALSIIGGAGVFGIVVGFAFRDIAENFLASLLLSLRQPFRRGDYITVDGQSGTVQSMNTRSTVLVSIEGNHIQIPNATVFKNNIVNFTTAPMRRETLDVGIGYDVSITDAQDVILNVLTHHEAVMTDPAPMVLVDTLGGSTVNIRAYFWMDGHRYSVLKVRSALLRLIKKALIEEGISMPDEAREIIFPNGVPIVAAEGRTGDAADHSQGVAAHPAASRAPQPESAFEPEHPASAGEGDLSSDADIPPLNQPPATAGEGTEDLLDGPETPEQR